MDIDQGTQIEQSALDKLKLGMTKEQVTFVLGSPSTQDVYTSGRWDYLQQSNHHRNKKDNTSKQLALWFEGDSLERVAAHGYNVAHLQGDTAVRMAKNTVKRTIPTPQAVTPLPSPVTNTMTVASSEPSALPDHTASIETDIQTTVDIWSSAWSNQDVSTYVAQYIQGYSPSKALRHSTWVKRRNTLISRPKFIRLNISDMHIDAPNEQQASAQFVQAYQSDRYHDTIVKKLTFVKEQGQWKISKETTLQKLN